MSTNIVGRENLPNVYIKQIDINPKLELTTQEDSPSPKLKEEKDPKLLSSLE